MSIDRSGARRARPRAHFDDAHTDPFLPRITDEMLPPLAEPRVPVLDDESLAEIIADLDDPGIDRPAPSVPGPRAEPAAPPPPGAAPGGTAPPDPPPWDAVMLAPPAEAPAPEVSGPARASWPPAVRGAEPGVDAPVRAGRRRGGLPPTRPTETADDEQRTFGPEDDPSVLRDSADGPVLRSRYGDFRPPVPVGRRSRDPENDWYLPDAPSLTGLGLTRRSWSRRGSRLFHWAFVALFALILLQLLVGLVTAAATP